MKFYLPRYLLLSSANTIITYILGLLEMATSDSKEPHSNASTPSSSSTGDPPKNIRPLSRFVTTHDYKSGKSIFFAGLSEKMPIQRMHDGAFFSLAYTSDHFPAELQDDRDIDEYRKYLADPPGITISTGSVCRIVDFPPYLTSPMHRTVSLDYGVVLEGEVELILDGGESRILKRGDVAVQRGTNHAWKNVTPDVVDKDGKRVGAWARMLYVLTPAKPIEVEGVGKLEEVVTGIGVRGSR
ncbi:hypothetical protein VTN77DRAFT_5108 [Rasamsonia byssochlamydoides]|uniref:uncharacterized protein n=1 Tax=Rasamsonia byssochlamydoides TaxID=89139 RepID=UPI0037443439